MTNTIKQIFTRDVAENVANKLSNLFDVDKKETIYSLGFQRWQKLSLSKRKTLMLKNDFNYQNCLAELEAI